MAFTFTVEDGSIVEDANSYVSVEEADDINGIDVHSTWGELDELTKQKLLAFATRYLDDRVYWLAQRKTANQPLRWPRVGARDNDGFEYLDTVVPSPVRRVAARLAAVFNEESPEAMESAVGVRRFRAELVEVEWQEGFMGRSAPAFLNSMALGGLGYGPNDHGFKRIIKK